LNIDSVHECPDLRRSQTLRLKHRAQRHRSRLAIDEQVHRAPAARSAPACLDGTRTMPAPSASFEAIHPEPTGYADFAARLEAAKSRGVAMQVRGREF
jgi:hypothetical protein